MMLPYNLATEFQYSAVNPGRNPVANPLDKLIKIALHNRDNPFKLLKEGFLMWFKALDPSLECINIATVGQDAVPLIQRLPFNRITCEFLSAFILPARPGGKLMSGL